MYGKSTCIVSEGQVYPHSEQHILSFHRYRNIFIYSNLLYLSWAHVTCPPFGTAHPTHVTKTGMTIDHKMRLKTGGTENLFVLLVELGYYSDIITGFTFDNRI